MKLRYFWIATCLITMFNIGIFLYFNISNSFYLFYIAPFVAICYILGQWSSMKMREESGENKLDALLKTAGNLVQKADALNEKLNKEQEKQEKQKAGKKKRK